MYTDKKESTPSYQMKRKSTELTSYPGINQLKFPFLFFQI
jgi:hypothetical protein